MGLWVSRAVFARRSAPVDHDPMDIALGASDAALKAGLDSALLGSCSWRLNQGGLRSLGRPICRTQCVGCGTGRAMASPRGRRLEWMMRLRNCLLTWAASQMDPLRRVDSKWLRSVSQTPPPDRAPPGFANCPGGWAGHRGRRPGRSASAPHRARCRWGPLPRCR